MFNLSDCNKYFGTTDGTNRYKAVYDQVSRYLKELNPGGFNQNVKRIVPYEEAVNTSFVKLVKGDYVEELTGDSNFVIHKKQMRHTNNKACRIFITIA